MIGVAPISLNVQEPGSQATVSLDVISEIVLTVPPSSCTYLCPCHVQPIIVAYDVFGNVIQKLGSADEPWLVVASLVGSPSGVNVIGAITNYTNGAAQFTVLGITAAGSYQIQFTFISPYGVSRYITDFLRIKKTNFSFFISFVFIVHLLQMLI
jgi:hypothetical protein